MSEWHDAAASVWGRLSGIPSSMTRGAKCLIERYQ